jgi:hypothetical protein
MVRAIAYYPIWSLVIIALDVVGAPDGPVAAAGPGSRLIRRGTQTLTASPAGWWGNLTLRG